MAPSLGRAILVGIVIWILATLVFRFLGQFFFVPDRAALLLLFGLGGPAFAASAIALRRWWQPDPASADRIAIGLVGPGVLLDTFTTSFFGTLLPNLDPSLADESGALMLWGYGWIALGIAIDCRVQQKRSTVGRG